MARAETENRTITEKAGRAAVITGLALIAYGLIGAFVEVPGPEGKIGLAGAGLAVSGVIFERIGRKKQ